MRDDPAGYYARLGVQPTATAEAITAAFRRKARLLHPDVPRTGNAEAFIRIKEAYDVLSDAKRRAAYDRSAQSSPIPVAPVVAPRATMRWADFSDIPMILWAGLGGVLCLVIALAVVQLDRSPRPVRREVTGPGLPWVRAGAPRGLPRIKPAEGVATHYVLPATGIVVIWRRDPASGAYKPIGQLGAFSPVQVLNLLPDAGLVEIRLGDGGSGFVEASRLAPGDRVAARRAFCAYNAGPAPENGEVLNRGGVGNAQLAISNHGMESAVVKMRDDAGRTVVAVFVAPKASTVVANLPDGRYRPDFAVGELWSRACQVFAAGMRAQRFADYAPLADMASLVIPPDPSSPAAPIDIPDGVFVKN